jgi:hypothetical protein
MSQVAGFTPSQAEVAMGDVTQLIGLVNGKAPFTPCLSFSWDNDIEILAPILGLVGADKVNQLDSPYIRKAASVASGLINTAAQTLVQKQAELNAAVAQFANGPAVVTAYGQAITSLQNASNQAAIASQDADDLVNSTATAAELQNSLDFRTIVAKSLVQASATGLNTQIQQANVAAQTALATVHAALDAVTGNEAAAGGDALVALTDVANSLTVTLQTVQNVADQIVNLVPAAAAIATDGVGLLISTFLGATVGEAFEFLAGGDLLVPTGTNDDNINDRGIMTHEYGHFALCNLLNAKSPSTFAAIYDTAAAERVISGEDPTQQPSVLNEAFADLIASQVVSATNYALPPHSMPSIGKSGSLPIEMNYCPAAFSSNDPNLPAANLGLASPGPCMESNFVVATAADGSTQGVDYFTAILRSDELFTDVLDGGLRVPGTPSNGNAWVALPTGGLQIGTGPGDAGNDELVAVSGSIFPTWIGHAISRGSSLTYNNVFGGLSDAMIDQGINWCERCQLFELHTSDTAGNLSCPTQWVGMRPTFNTPGATGTLSCTFDGACPMGTTANPKTMVCEPGCPPGQAFDDVQLICVNSIIIG